MGHSSGGLVAQIIANRGLSAATVTIDLGPFRGVLPLPISALRAASPVLRTCAPARACVKSHTSLNGGVGCGLRQRRAEEALHGVEWLGALVCSAQDQGALESCEEYGGIVLCG
jgi:hypothetical protein